MRGCLCIFVYIWMMTSSIGSRTIQPILWLKFFLDSRPQYESLEGLVDFLAFLVQELWQNKQKLITEIPWHYSALEIARAANSPVFGPSAKGFETVRQQLFSGDVIPGRYGLLANKAKFLFFAKFQNLTMKLFAAVLFLSPFCLYSVSLVSLQISEPC